MIAKKLAYQALNKLLADQVPSYDIERAAQVFDILMDVLPPEDEDRQRLERMLYGEPCARVGN